MSISIEELELKKYETKLSFIKTIIIGVVVTLVTAIISASVSIYISWLESESKLTIERLKVESNLKLNQKVKDNDFISQFLDKAVTEDLNVKFDFSEYMSVVAASKEQRKRWKEYHLIIQEKINNKNLELKRVQSTLATIQNIKNQQINKDTSSINFEQSFQRIRTDELALSNLGTKAYKNKEFKWAIQIFNQADLVKASGVWQSSFPYLIASYYSLNEINKAKETENELLMRIKNSLLNGYGYLSNDIPLGFMLSNMGDARKSLPIKYHKNFDSLIDKVILLKQKVN